MKLKKSTRYFFAFVLIVIMAIIIGSLVLNYRVKPKELHYLDKSNLIEDNSFENFNKTVYDCCNSDNSKSKVFASKSTEAIDGKYSLNLTSESQCACIDESFTQLFNNKKYFVSFYYKGDSPRICVWASKDDTCMLSKSFYLAKDWKKYQKIISFTNKSRTASVFFYADSEGIVTTNLYDDLQVHQLIEMSPDYPFSNDEQYIVKTDSSNIVHNGEPLPDEPGYYLVQGTPDITIHFPWPELVLLLAMMLIVIRLLFMTQSEKIAYRLERENREISKNLPKSIKYMRR